MVWYHFKLEKPVESIRKNSLKFEIFSNFKINSAHLLIFRNEISVFMYCYLFV
jgi:hypothetical protein